MCVTSFHGPHGLSGYGFELTFRLKKVPGQMMPPSWPAELMQELAKYVFRTGSSFLFIIFQVFNTSRLS